MLETQVVGQVLPCRRTPRQVGTEFRMILDEAGLPVKAVTRFQFQTRKIVTQQEFNMIFRG